MFTYRELLYVWFTYWNQCVTIKSNKNYEEALIQLNLNSLAERRRHLCLKFAQSGEKHEKLTDLFTKNDKNHDMKMRNSETYKVNFANTERYRKSSVVYLQSELNNSLL